MARRPLLNCVEPFVPAADIFTGGAVPVYNRADLSRTVTVVVALFLTAVPANAVVFDTRSDALLRRVE
jgi:hypothetical protein